MLKWVVYILCVSVLLKFQSYQEAGGVVQQTAEAADEASLQEGGVLRWKLVGFVTHQAGRGRHRLAI